MEKEDAEQSEKEPKLLSLIVSAVLMFGVLVLVLVQVFARYLGMSPTWTEEMVRWVWVWVACLGFGAVEYGREHVSMDYLPAKLAPKARAILLLVFDLTSFAVSLDLIWLSWKSVRINWDTTASTVPISRGFFYASLLVGGALMAFHTARHIIRRIAAMRLRDGQQEREKIKVGER